MRDEYTTLPDIKNRPLHMWLDLDWSYTEPGAASTKAQSRRRVRKTSCTKFSTASSRAAFSRSSIRSARSSLPIFPAVEEVHLEANNRTWDTIAEQGDESGVYTDARPPYGCLGLTLE